MLHYHSKDIQKVYSQVADYKLIVAVAVHSVAVCSCVSVVCRVYYVAHALHSAVDPGHWHGGMGHSDSILVTKDTIMDIAAQLCRLLKYEFIFNPVSAQLCRLLKYEFIFNPVSRAEDFYFLY